MQHSYPSGEFTITTRTQYSPPLGEFTIVSLPGSNIHHLQLNSLSLPVRGPSIHHLQVNSLSLPGSNIHHLQVNSLSQYQHHITSFVQLLDTSTSGMLTLCIDSCFLFFVVFWFWRGGGIEEKRAMDDLTDHRMKA